MAERAQVTSVEAVEAFRSRLIVFLSKARPTLDEISSDVIRTRLWLQNDQRLHWEKEIRVRSRKLERAQSELLGARMSNLHAPSAAQQMDVHRAQSAVREARSKLALLKKWDRELENRAAPLVKEVDKLQSYLTGEMAGAVAYLGRMITTLEAYAGVVPTGQTLTLEHSAKDATSAGKSQAETAGQGTEGNRS